ncbi:MAG: ARMT1-like domain-containing protein [Planctomycetaceae bacterium]|jgi:uncharacterized protein with ATP-grasp and redox domains|nr:ARMT1-like domain-containing protein [Planctomycetaceae bacterium]
MPASLDCVLCLTRQSLEAARFATQDEDRHTAVLKAAFRIVQDIGFTENPPLVAQEIQRVIRKETENPDPYALQKNTSNELMLSVREEMRQRIRRSDEPFHLAVQFAVAGNTIDYAVKGDWDKVSIMQAFETALQQPVNGSIDVFAETLGKASNVLYLLDNCGEIVCDQLLIEEIQRRYPHISVTAAVRGLPVLNDAVMTDALQTGLDKTVRVIDNGNDAVGTVLEQCSEEFHRVLLNSDMLVAKGLANYETLIEYDKQTLPMPITYLFKAKCRFIARYAGVHFQDSVVRTV